MIDRTRFFGTNVVTAHSSRQMTSQRGKGGNPARPITVLEISDHEGGSARQGYLQRQRKL